MEWLVSLPYTKKSSGLIPVLQAPTLKPWNGLNFIFLFNKKKFKLRPISLVFLSTLSQEMRKLELRSWVKSERFVVEVRFIWEESTKIPVRSWSYYSLSLCCTRCCSSLNKVTEKQFDWSLSQGKTQRLSLIGLEFKLQQSLASSIKSTGWSESLSSSFSSDHHKILVVSQMWESEFLSWFRVLDFKHSLHSTLPSVFLPSCPSLNH